MTSAGKGKSTKLACVLHDLILERQAFRIVLLEPFLRGVHVREHLDVFFVADLLAGVDVNENGHWSLLSFPRTPVMLACKVNTTFLVGERYDRLSTPCLRT